MADLGFGVQPAAQHFALDFIPVIDEDYFFACERARLDEARLACVLDILRSEAFNDSVAHLEGYDPARCGSLVDVDEGLERRVKLSGRGAQRGNATVKLSGARQKLPPASRITVNLTACCRLYCSERDLSAPSIAMKLSSLACSSAALIAGAVYLVPVAFAQNSPGMPGGVLQDQFRLNEHPQMQFAASAPSDKYQQGNRRCVVAATTAIRTAAI